MEPQDLVKQKLAVLKEYYKRNPFEWIKTCVQTADEHDKENPVKSFPIRPYVEVLTKAFQEEDILHVPKSRQLTISWLFMALLLHEAQFHGYRLEAVISKKEDDAFHLVERAKFMYDHQPSWIKTLCPLDRKLRDMPFGSLFFQNGSKIRGFPQGADQVRSFVPSTAFLDELGFQDKAKETYEACVPCCSKIVTVSSANPGFFQTLVKI